MTPSFVENRVLNWNRLHRFYGSAERVFHVNIRWVRNCFRLESIELKWEKSVNRGSSWTVFFSNSSIWAYRSKSSQWPHKIYDIPTISFEDFIRTELLACIHKDLQLIKVFSFYRGSEFYYPRFPCWPFHCINKFVVRVSRELPRRTFYSHQSENSWSSDGDLNLGQVKNFN